MAVTPVELVQGYLTWLQRNRGRSARTVEIYRLALELLLECIDGADPRQATDDQLVLFTGLWLHKRGVAAASRGPYVAAVRGFYKWMNMARHASSNPAAALPYPKVGKPLPRAMSLQNAEKLMFAPDFNTFEGVRDGAVLAIFTGCGLRVSGLVKLNVSDVIEEVVDGRPRLMVRSREKGDKERLVPVPLEADLQLRVYMEHPYLKEVDLELENGDKVLFISTRNRRCPGHLYRGDRRRITERGVQKMITTYGKRLGISAEQLHPHALRHLYGTELAEGDVDLQVRMDLMGHADERSNRVYTRLAMRKRFKSVDHAGPLAKMRTPVSDLLQTMQVASKPTASSSPAPRPTQHKPTSSR